MSDPYHIPDGELCRICGLTFYSRSYGGPGICPSCDCGNFGIQAIENQRKEIQRLAASVDRLTSDKARLAVELAAEQESNTFLNNLHKVDQDRILAFEAALKEICECDRVARHCDACQEIATDALRTTAETKGEQDG